MRPIPSALVCLGAGSIAVEEFGVEAIAGSARNPGAFDIFFAEVKWRQVPEFSDGGDFVAFVLSPK
jgi:hypothetical protein